MIYLRIIALIILINHIYYFIFSSKIIKEEHTVIYNNHTIPNAPGDDNDFWLPIYAKELDL